MSAKDRELGHFRTLGLGCHASDAEIQELYYRSARVHHPDHNYGDPDAADRFKRIQFAYEKLSNRSSVSAQKATNPFPFVVPETSKGKLLGQWLLAFVAVMYLSASLWVLVHSEPFIATQPKVTSSVQSHRPIASVESAASAASVARDAVQKNSVENNPAPSPGNDSTEQVDRRRT